MPVSLLVETCGTARQIGTYRDFFLAGRFLLQRRLNEAGALGVKRPTVRAEAPE